MAGRRWGGIYGGGGKPKHQPGEKLFNNISTLRQVSHATAGSLLVVFPSGVISIGNTQGFIIHCQPEDTSFTLVYQQVGAQVVHPFLTWLYCECSSFLVIPEMKTSFDDKAPNIYLREWNNTKASGLCFAVHIWREHFFFETCFLSPFSHFGPSCFPPTAHQNSALTPLHHSVQQQWSGQAN